MGFFGNWFRTKDTPTDKAAELLKEHLHAAGSDIKVTVRDYEEPGVALGINPSAIDRLAAGNIVTANQIIDEAKIAGFVLGNIAAHPERPSDVGVCPYEVTAPTGNQLLGFIAKATGKGDKAR